MIRVDLDGSALRAALDKYKDQLLANVRVGVGKAGQLIKKEAKQRCPVDTDRLRGSIDSRVEDDGQGGIVAKIGTNVEYALHVEYGHRTRLGTGGKKSSLYQSKKAGGGRTLHVVPGMFFLHNAFTAKRDAAVRLIIAAITKKG